MIKTDGVPTIAWADPPAACPLTRVKHVHKVELTDDELELLAEALDSHRYWQLSDETYRNDGYVLKPGSDDAEVAAEIKQTEELEDRLRQLFAAHRR